jgi:hypothetical protein
MANTIAVMLDRNPELAIRPRERLAITISMALQPINPGEILWKDYPKPMEYLAKDLHVAPYRFDAIVLGKRSILADTVPHLAHYRRSYGSIRRMPTSWKWR